MGIVGRREVEVVETLEIVETPPKILDMWRRYAPWYKKTFGKFWVFRGFAKKLRRYLLPVSGGVVLDAGCGPALYAKTFIRRLKPSRLVCIDVSPEMLEEARGTVNKWWMSWLCRWRNCQIELKQADLCKGTPFADGTFAAQFYLLVMYYLPFGEWRNVLAEAFRVAKPGGYVVSTNVLGRFDFKEELGFWRLLKELTHPRAIKRFMKNVKPILTGFQDMAVEGVIGYPSLQELLGLHRDLGFERIEFQYIWKTNTVMIRGFKPR